MLSTLLGLLLQIDREADRDEAELLRRDRELDLAAPRSAHRRLRHWLDRVQHEADAERVRTLLVAWRSLGLLLAVLGLVAGATAAAAIFSYDGKHPINILPAIGIFAVLPLLMLVPLAIGLLPYPVARAVPGLVGLQETLGMLGAATLSFVMRLLPARHRHALEMALGRGRAGVRVFGSVNRWTLLSASQAFALAFHIGAITWFVARVLVSDLSFTWSTTVEQLTPERVHAVTEWLSAPWSAWLPDAVPSIEDVRATQYFRLGSGSVAGVQTEAVDPTALGRWWTFLLACMVSYGLVPRLLSWFWCSIQRARAVRRTILLLPGVDRVLHRLERARLRSDAPVAEPAEATLTSTTPSAPVNTVGKSVLIVWSGLGIAEADLDRALVNALGTDVAAHYTAGAGRTLAQDTEVVAEVASRVRALGAHSAVVVAVKAWEPPTKEILDFLVEMRSPLGDGVPVVVAAIHAPDHSSSAAHADAWRRRLATIGDPWLRAIAIEPAGGSS